MESTAQGMAVIDSGTAWLIPLPKDGFTVPKFRFSQMVGSQDGACGRIVGMEFVKEGSGSAHYITGGWHYAVALTVPPAYLRVVKGSDKYRNRKPG